MDTKNFNTNTIEFSNVKFDIYNKELREYLFLKSDLSFVTFEPELFFEIFSEASHIILFNAYITLLEIKNSEKIISLKKYDELDFDKIIISLCEDLNTNLEDYLGIFFVLESTIKTNYKEKYPEGNIKNPLDEVLDSPFVKNFFGGLDLDYSEQVFFITNILNNKWKFIYPANIIDDYNFETYKRILNSKDEFSPHYQRLLNEKFMRLHLFSDTWKPADYVNSYFQNKNQTFTKENFSCDAQMDSYDYNDIEKINKTDSELFRKVLFKTIKNEESTFLLFYGSNNYRLKNYLHFNLQKNNFALKTLSTKNFEGNQNELVFNIYALARECFFENSILCLDSNFVNNLFQTKKEEKNFFDFLTSSEKNYNDNFEILSKNKTPVILLSELTEISSLTKENFFETLEAKNINISFFWKLNLPKENKYLYCAKRYFANNKDIPLSILGSIVNECYKNNISFENWEKVSALFSHAENFTKRDVKILIKNKFKIYEETPKQKISTTYSFEALNTNPPISEILTSLQNAKKWQEKHNDDGIGVLAKLYGPSGSGKSLFAKKIAKDFNMPLKIVHPSDIFSSLAGETEVNIKNVFEDAKETNSILLFDEADSFLHARGDSLNRHNDFKVNEFLIQMEEFNGILFCCTNLPESFDMATDRRFNFHVEFKSLTKEGVDILCDSYFKEFSLTENQKNKIFESGEVTPGDFGTLYRNLKFISEEKINSEFICQELIKIVKIKTRSNESTKQIGFAI